MGKTKPAGAITDETAASSTGSTGSGSTGGAGGGLVWPFATKKSSQYRRVDAGWDLQDKSGANIYAIAPGTLHIYNKDPGEFGDDYPTVELDHDIGGPTKTVYYGHVHTIPALDGQHVDAGQLIAHANTFYGEKESGADPGWLEIGFAQPGTDAPVAPTDAPGPPGHTMKRLLLGAEPGSGGGSTPAPTASSSSSTTCCPGGSSSSTGLTPTPSGSSDAETAFNYFISTGSGNPGLSKQGAAGIVGNLMRETGGDSFNLDPSSSPPASSYYGTFQWSAIRWAGVVDYANKQTPKKSPQDLTVQLEYAWKEMNTSSYKSVVPKLKNATDPKQAASDFNSIFEGGSDVGLRQADAQKAYDNFKDNTPSSTTGGSSGSASTSTACCATGGSTGSPSDLDKFLKVLAYQESGGDPHQPGSAGGARGKYQDIRLHLA